jgi:hypothetical protein
MKEEETMTMKNKIQSVFFMIALLLGITGLSEAKANPTMTISGNVIEISHLSYLEFSKFLEARKTKNPDDETLNRITSYSFDISNKKNEYIVIIMPIQNLHSTSRIKGVSAEYVFNKNNALISKKYFK